MAIIGVIFLAAALVWALVYAYRGSLAWGCALFLVVGYVLTRDFFRLQAGPIPLTIDRFLLVGLTALFGWRWWRGTVHLRAISGTDLVAAVFVGYLALRWAITPPIPAGTELIPDVSPAWRLIASFWMSFVLFTLVRNAELDRHHWRLMLTWLALLGLYLGLTATAEVTKQWWAVFPRFIADPTLGTHFGRARGPMLMSASLGLYLSVCFWAAWFLWQDAGRWTRLALAGAMLAMMAGVFFTMTRSCWLGLAGGLAVIPLLQWPRSWKVLHIIGLSVAVTLSGILVGGKIVDMGRKDSDGSAGHSVSQRASFVVVSMRMFRDAPLMGCGFGRFFDKKLPYLADRTQQIELDSLRKLDHHNTFLSVLTETGLIGFTLFIAVLIGWTRQAWRLFHNSQLPNWARAQGLFSLATLIAYLLNAAFHDLTLMPSEQWILCLVTGITSGLCSPSLRAVTEPRPVMALAECPAASTSLAT
jgi:O-antigen ligase